MPWGDGTGPMGLGPGTGRGLGRCRGFGQGRGFGPGRGWRWRLPDSNNSIEERLSALERQIRELKDKE